MGEVIGRRCSTISSGWSFYCPFITACRDCPITYFVWDDQAQSLVHDSSRHNADEKVDSNGHCDGSSDRDRPRHNHGNGWIDRGLVDRACYTPWKAKRLLARRILGIAGDDYEEGLLRGDAGAVDEALRWQDAEEDPPEGID